MGIQINGSNDTISASDGSLSLPGADLTTLTQVNVTGVGTFGNGLRVTGGTVGVNTTAVDAQLEVHSAASKINTATIKTSAGASGYAGLAFMAGQTTAGREKAAIYFQETNGGAHYTGDLVFALNSNSGSATQVSTSDERVRITGIGSVGIGITIPRSLLDVQGGQFRIRASGTYSDPTDNAGIIAYDSISGDMNISARSSGGSTALAFRTSNGGTGSERARFNSTGAFVLAGGTTTADGIGIAFPATQSASTNANTLDDYEEGTFTPTIIGTTTAGTGTYATQVGRYTKIGNRVYYNIYMSWSAHTGTGFLRASGLPFTSNSTTGAYNAASFWMDSIALSTTHILEGYVGPGETVIRLESYASGGGASSNINMDTSGALMISGHYEV